MNNSPIHKPMPHRFLTGLIVMTVIGVLFFGVRSFYWSEPAVDEDGLFAKIVMDHSQGPRYTFLARISLKDYYIHIAHPGIIYEVLKTPGFILNMHRHRGDPIGQRSIPSLRIAMSMFQFAVILLLLLALIPRSEGPRGWLPFGACAVVILAWTLAPQSIVSSLDLQVDGSVGVLMVGALGVAVIFASGMPNSTLRLGLVFLTAAFLGCGKTTWTLCAIAAIGLSGLFSQALRLRGARLYTTIAGGILFGNLIGYRFDPENYRRSLDRLVGFASSQTGTIAENVAQKLPADLANIGADRHGSRAAHLGLHSPGLRGWRTFAFSILIRLVPHGSLDVRLMVFSPLLCSRLYRGSDLGRFPASPSNFAERTVGDRGPKRYWRRFSCSRHSRTRGCCAEWVDRTEDRRHYW